MWHVLVNTKSYFFWLVAVSLVCFVLERFFAWRRDQPVWRKDLWQDVFFLIFNGHYAGLLLAMLGTFLIEKTAGWFDFEYIINDLQSVTLLAGWPIVLQAFVFLLAKDFVSWFAHMLLHRVPWMWELHKLHHSITELDWIGNFRFHWMEIVIYKAFTWLPLLLLGVAGNVILIIAVIETFIGHLNHSNIPWGYGKMGYIINNPRFHVWHHDMVNHGRYGQNFAIVFSLWDWIFGTAYFPKDSKMPKKLGFDTMAQFPRSLWKRLVHPVWKVIK